MNLEYLQVTSSWIPGILVLVLLAAFVAYGRWSDKLSHRKAEGSALKKAA